MIFTILVLLIQIKQVLEGLVLEQCFQCLDRPFMEGYLPI